MHRTIVAGEITDETLDDFCCEATPPNELANIEQVTRMLPIHRGYQLATVQFGRGQERYGQLRGE